MKEDGNNNAEVKAYEEQINNLQYKLSKSKRIVAEQEERIKEAKKELLVLWRMEINSAVDKKKEAFNLLGTGDNRSETRKRNKRKKKGDFKIKKIITRKTCMYLKMYA